MPRRINPETLHRRQRGVYEMPPQSGQFVRSRVKGSKMIRPPRKKKRRRRIKFDKMQPRQKWAILARKGYTREEIRRILKEGRNPFSRREEPQRVVVVTSGGGLRICDQLPNGVWVISKVGGQGPAKRIFSKLPLEKMWPGRID